MHKTNFNSPPKPDALSARGDGNLGTWKTGDPSSHDVMATMSLPGFRRGNVTSPDGEPTPKNYEESTMNIESPYRHNYHHSVLTSDPVQNEKTLIAAGLDATEGPFSPEGERGRILVSLKDRYVAVTAKGASLLLTLGALEARSDVLPSHVFQIIGGETRLYPISYDTLVRSYFSDELGLYGSSLTIEAGSEPLELSPIAKEQCHLFWQIEDEILCGDIHTFFRDVWDFNLGTVSVEARATVANSAI